MNGFTVELTPEAEDDLADIWIRAKDRPAVTAAEAAIHHLLADDPIGNGTLVAEGLFRIRHAPLVAFYAVDLARKHVDVSKVWRPH